MKVTVSPTLFVLGAMCSFKNAQSLTKVYLKNKTRVHWCYKSVLISMVTMVQNSRMNKTKFAYC